MLRVFLLLCLVNVSLSILPNCRAPGELVPGALTQCDIALECDWCERNHLSFDFLCCETGKWIGTHLTNPLLFYLMWNDVPFTIILFLAFEVLEIINLTLLHSFDLLFADIDDSETLAGSMIGDALIQGGLGLIIGYCLRALFLVPTLVSSLERARAYDARGRRRVYIVVYLLAVLPYLLPGRVAASGARWGLWILTAISLIFIWCIFPFAFNTEVDDKMIWQRLDGSMYSGSRKTWFFILWGLVVIASHTPHFATLQPYFMINEWYQQWIIMIPFTLVLLLITFVVSVQRHDGFTSWVAMGIIAAMMWFILWTIEHLTQSTSNILSYVGAVVLVFSLIFFAIAGFNDWPSTVIPYTRERDSYYAVQSTREASRYVPKEAETSLLLNEQSESSVIDSSDTPSNSLRKRSKWSFDVA